MPAKTKYTKRSKKQYRGRRKFGKKAKLYRDVKSFKLTGKECQIFSTYQSTLGPNVSTAGAGIGIGNLTFVGSGGTRANFTGTYVSAFDRVYQLSQLNTLFDRYKIHGVKLKFIPQWNVADVYGAAILPTIKLVHDYDDANVNDSANTVASIWARQGRVMSLRKPFSVYIRPKIANIIYQASGTTAQSPMKSPYINMAYPSVPMFALKFAVRDWYAPQSADGNIRLKIEPTYYVSLREQLCPNAVDTIIQLDEDGNEVNQNNELPQDEEQGDEILCENKPTV